MDAQPPPATGQRLHWSELPEHVRSEVERRLGGYVVSADTQPGGFSPGLAARVRTAGGARAFVKAVATSPNPDSPAMHRREAEIVASLPREAPVPQVLWSFEHDDGGWVVLGFEDVDGRHPHLPWRADELARVIDALDDLAESLTPSPIVADSASAWVEADLRGWRKLAEHPSDALDPWSREHLDVLAELESQAAAAIAGDTLLHLDLRADNVLIAGDRVWFVDWPWARVGAAWADVVGFAPSVAMQGGPAPEELFARSGSSRIANSDAVTAFVAAVAGYFVEHSLRPPLPGLPTLREFQAAQGAVAVSWIKMRLS